VLLVSIVEELNTHLVKHMNNIKFLFTVDAFVCIRLEYIRILYNIVGGKRENEKFCREF